MNTMPGEARRDALRIHISVRQRMRVQIGPRVPFHYDFILRADIRCIETKKEQPRNDRSLHHACFFGAFLVFLRFVAYPQKEVAAKAGAPFEGWLVALSSRDVVGGTVFFSCHPVTFETENADNTSLLALREEISPLR